MAQGTVLRAKCTFVSSLFSTTRLAGFSILIKPDPDYLDL
jgi:hypothetical protein